MVPRNEQFVYISLEVFLSNRPTKSHSDERTGLASTFSFDEFVCNISPIDFEVL